MALLESLRRRMSPASQERQHQQNDKTNTNRSRVLEVGEDFLHSPGELGGYQPDSNRRPIGTVIHAENRFTQRGSISENDAQPVGEATPVEGRLARPLETTTVTVEQNSTAAVEERQRLLEQSRSDLEYIQNTLKERLAEQSGWLNRIRRIFEATSETARKLKMHLQDTDNALRLSARTGVSESTLSSIQSTVQRLRQEYSIVTPSQPTRSTEARPATASVTAPVNETVRMTDLTPEQQQAKLIERVTKPLEQALKNSDREAGIKQAASGMVQMNQMIEQLMLPSKNRRFRLPEATANVIQDIYREFSPMADEIVNKKPDPKVAPTLTDLAGKTLSKELGRFSRFAENLGSVSTTSVDNDPTVTIEARGQIQQLMEAMFNSRLNHLREAIQNNQPERIINVIRDINRSLQQYELRDIPESVVVSIEQQLEAARTVFQRPAVANLESIYKLRLDMTTAEHAFNIFRQGYEQHQATRQRVASRQQ